MLLLDTHVVLWLALAPESISERATEAMSDSRKHRSGLAVAACTLWEIATLHAKARIQLDVTLEFFLRQVEATYHVLGLTHAIATRGVLFEKPYPKDPADRQIGATALIHQLDLVTADEAIRRSKQVACIW